jgi:hypothetical protein
MFTSGPPSQTHHRNVRARLAFSTLVGALVIAAGASAAGTLDQSQPSFGPSFFGSGNCGVVSPAQTFTAGVSGELDQVDIGVWRDPSNASAALELRIQAAPGGVPSGSALASASIPASGFATSAVEAAFMQAPLESAVRVIEGQQYAIVLLPTGLDCFAGYWWIYVENDAYPRGGALVQISDGGWQELSRATPDFAFRTYVSPTRVPTSTQDCQRDGWRAFPQFKNEGDCVSFVVTEGRNSPG